MLTDFDVGVYVILSWDGYEEVGASGREEEIGGKDHRSSEALISYAPGGPLISHNHEEGLRNVIASARSGQSGRYLRRANLRIRFCLSCRHELYGPVCACV